MAYADYKAINETPRRHARRADAAARDSDHRPGPGWKTLSTDGPFVETKEAIGGYLFFEADDLDAAIELAARVPTARTDAEASGQ